MPHPEEAVPKSAPLRLAPLPVPVANPAFKRIARPRVVERGNPAALIPFFYAALLFLAGIVLAHFAFFRPSYLLVGLLPLALLAAIAILRTPRLVWLPMSSLWLVLGIWSAESEPEPAPNPQVAQLSDGLLRTVEGTVTDAGPLKSVVVPHEDADEIQTEMDRDSRSSDSDAPAQQVDLQLSAVEVVTDTTDALTPIRNSNSARVRLTIDWPKGASNGIACGQRLRAVVRILPADTFHDPGVWSREAYLESQQITALARVNATRRDGDESRLQVLDNSGDSFPACLLNRWRDSASARLQILPSLTRRLPAPFRATPQDVAMLTALLTGDRTFLNRSLRVGFERTGSFHLIVVSGLHLAILAGVVFALARRLRLGRVPATALTVALTLGYALFTGFGIPAQRAFWMITLYLVGRLLYRDRSPLNAVGFATLCLAAASPRSIFDASLQMTLLAVTSIAGVAVPLLEGTLTARSRATRDLSVISLDPKLPPRIAQFRVTLRLIARHLEPAAGRWIAWELLPRLLRWLLHFGELLFVTLVVELALALPMAMYFHRITVYALPVNLFILPILSIFVPAAMILLIVLAIWPAAAVLPAAVCLAILHLSVSPVRSILAHSLGDLRVPDPPSVQIAAAFVLFLIAVQLVRAPIAKHSGLQRQLAFAALLAMAAVALWPRSIDHPADALLFEAIDVGQGDSLLLITPEGKTVLLDGGGLGFLGSNVRIAHSDFDVGEEVVSPVLWSRGIRRLDAVALTHAHHDHMGGLPAILRNFRPRELWVGNNPTVPAYLTLLRQASTLGVRVRSFHAGDSIRLGAAEFRVLAPALDYRPGPQPANNDSLVLQARYRETSILLAGDAEAPEENFLLSQGSPRSTLLKVGHHGSLTSTRPQFLAAVDPAWAVISCGRRNRFGHPRMEILAELQAAHVRTFRTDVDGAVCFLLNGQTVVAQPHCEASVDP